MIVLDASVLIGFLDGRDRHHTAARAVLEASGSTPLGASAITLAEILAYPARAVKLGDAQRALDRLGVAELKLDDAAPRRLAELRASTGLKLPDCCVLLAAQEHEGVIATFDEDLARTARDLGLEAIA